MFFKCRRKSKTGTDIIRYLPKHRLVSAAAHNFGGNIQRTHNRDAGSEHGIEVVSDAGEIKFPVEISEDRHRQPHPVKIRLASISAGEPPDPCPEEYRK